MNLTDRCPFCGSGARAVKDSNQSWVEFKCFSMIGNVVGEFQYRSPICRHAELNAAKARIAELEAREKQRAEDEAWAGGMGGIRIRLDGAKWNIHHHDCRRFGGSFEVFSTP